MKFNFILAVSLVFLMSFGVFAQNAKSKTEPIGVGAIAPDFTLSDETGKQVSLSKVGKTTVLVFYRGYWCPFCARQLAELRNLLNKDDNIALYAVSIDNPETSKTFGEKIAKDGKGALGFPILSDPNHKTIDNYGLFDTTYVGKGVEGIPHPAIYILDKNRKIVWAKIEYDYKKRPTNEDIRAELAKLK